MKKIIKKEVIISFIVGIILASSIAVYAYSCAAKDVSYTKPGENTPISVEAALNELYSKGNKTPQQVATLTTQGASYTFQNDGYIKGTVSQTNGMDVWFTIGNNDNFIACPNDTSSACSVCYWVEKGTEVKTQSGRGTWNLILYEFK